MAFNTRAVIEYLETLAAGIPGVQAVYTGIPNVIEERVVVVIAMAAPAYDDAATQLVIYTPRIYVGFGYKLAGATKTQLRTAELTVVDAFDDFIAAVIADRRLGGTVDDVLFDFSFSNNALYQAFVGQELRLLPVSLQVSMQQLIAA